MLSGPPKKSKYKWEDKFTTANSWPFVSSWLNAESLKSQSGKCREKSREASPPPVGQTLTLTSCLAAFWFFPIRPGSFRVASSVPFSTLLCCHAHPLPW
ncbi:hypothetical protein PoB_007411500 [Plakobranchus ocellatus]|uniref:Uncharacterized protein n=1 Tax=Plakobranchus ocellatus TaxID=259542 RepID=A0AAV4DUA3_9GAST|nr:hypothetical protein PoB_007411500 [Plakobranchus ocellatus]